MSRLILFAFCLTQLVLAINAEGHYTVIGPGTIHSARKYNVAVGAHQNNEPWQLKVGITGPSYNETKLVDLQTNEVKTIEFDVPVLKKGDYNLTAEGVKGIEFKNTTNLYFESFKSYVKIQTDKGIYKPGDLINFRVIFLDENLKPGEVDKNTVIWIEDNKRNRIKEFKNIDGDVVKGVYTGKLQLSEFPNLGDWRLSVDNGGNYPVTVYFDVDKYVLPKYEVKVESTEKVSVLDGDMQVVVRAHYTYGKPVNGKVILLMELNKQYYYSSDDDKQEKVLDPPVMIKTNNLVNGKAKFDLNVKDYDVYLKDKTSSGFMTITATVEENYSDEKINGSAYTTLYPYRYFMTCSTFETCNTYYADKESEIAVQVVYVDGTHVKDKKSPVKLTYTESVRSKNWWMSNDKAKPATPKIENKTHIFESHLNDSSIAVFKISLPELEEFEEFFHFYSVEVEYANEKHHLTTTYPYRKPKQIPDANKYEEPKVYFKIEPQYEKEKYGTNLGKELVFKINSSAPIPYYTYDIVGRGNIIEHKRVELPEKPKLTELKLTTTFIMSPYANVYIYYVDEHGEYRYAETTYHVEAELQNIINVTAAEEVKPGADVPLRIKTAKNSFVGLLAIDQSSLQLRQNNEIGANDFRWRLGNYYTRTPWQGGYSTYPGDSSGLVTLTNADYFYNRTKPYNDVFPQSVLRTSLVSKTTEVQFASSPAKAGPPGVHNVAMDSSFGASGGGGGTINVRKDFAETWIFANIENTEAEEFTWTKKIPDTITTWVLSAFALSPEKGLGVLEQKTKVRTFQPFFVSIRLPYSVKRGEVINVPALVFNYLQKDLDVEVTLENTDNEYEFVEPSNEVINELKRVKTVRVPANSNVGVSFMLRPKVLGNIMLKFTAISPVAGDAVHKTLKVVPEGITEYKNHAYFVNLKDLPEFKDKFDLELPTEVVPDSEHIEFGVVGDLMGPLLRNLNSLLRLPTGCGEQTTSSLVPNYIVLQYLKTLKKLKPELENKIKNNLERGYQHILSFRNKDGSFSSFGYSLYRKKPLNGSTWLTAYVVRSLHEASEFIEVDKKILKEGLAFLAGKQAENGSFVEDGDYFYSSHRQHLTMTANVLLTFLENKEFADKYQTQIDKGFKYLLENYEKIDDIYAKALATYTLHKAQHPIAGDKIKELQSFVKTDGDRKWWSGNEKKYSYSSEVELTSYILLTLLDLETEDVQSVLPIVRWLIAQRNNYGGFYSTQDTVVGLKALTKFAEKSGYEAAIMDINIEAKGKKSVKETIKTNEDNALLLQTVELGEGTRSVEFNAKGKGAALVQVAYQYNIIEKEPKPSFTIDTVIDTKRDTTYKFDMDVCVEYVGDGESSNMAVLEISLPSGYIVEDSSLEDIKKIERIRHVETKNSDTVIVVYFESLLKGKPLCLPVEGLAGFAVALQKPSPVVLYDYYETTRRATHFYELSAKLCAICDNDEECEKACNRVPKH